jgi:hypothetical protein
VRPYLISAVAALASIILSALMTTLTGFIGWRR